MRRLFVSLVFVYIVLHNIYSLLNPAAVYCKELGYKYVIKRTSRGEIGYCILPNGKEVNVWDFYLGRVALNYSYCKKIGLEPVHVVGKNYEYTGCKLPNGTIVPVDILMNLSEKLIESKCGNGRCELGENYFNCPQDCPSGSLDNVCDKVEDGICDPDCFGKEDPDCLRKCFKNGKLDPDCRFKPWLDPDCSNINYPCFNYFVKNYSKEYIEYLKEIAGCNLCDHDGICEENETWFNCPSDCSPPENANCYGKPITKRDISNIITKIEISKNRTIKKTTKTRTTSTNYFLLSLLLSSFIIGLILIYKRYSQWSY